MLGHDDGSFRPFEQTTRMQLITIVARATGSLLRKPPDDWHGLVDSSNPTHGQEHKVGGIQRPPVGHSESDKLGHRRAATRGEVAQILYNLLVKTENRPPLTVLNYGAKGDGTTDDGPAIQRAIRARKSGGPIIIPAGTYEVDSTVMLESNITIQGIPDQTVLTMPAQSSEAFIMSSWPGGTISNVEISGIIFKASSFASKVGGMFISGGENCLAHDLRLEGLYYGLKLGSGPMASGWVVTNIVARDCLQPLFMAKIKDSSFVDLDLEAVEYSNQYHSVYVERECYRVSFTDISLSGSGGYCLHLYASDGQSGDITFTNTVIDATNGRYGVVVGGRFANITFDTLAITQTDASGPCISFSDPSNVVIDGIVARGGSSLFACTSAPDRIPTDCIIKNGTYDGPEIGAAPGVKITNVTLL